MTPRNTLIAAAVFAEVKPLVRRLRLVRSGPIWRGPGNDGVTLALTGMGADRAVETVGRLLDELRPAAVWSVGVAGALRPDLRIGDVLGVSAVIDAATGDRFEPTAALSVPRSGTLVTAAALAATPDAKRALRDRFAADAVDLETAAIARHCVERGVPWASVRAISDTADAAVPAALGELIDPAGQPRTGAIVRWALRDPRRIVPLIRLARHTAHAARSLAATLAPFV